MTSWIAIIDSAYPQHWKIAKDRGFWDTTSDQKVSLGDTIYFWQGGRSLLAQCTATSARYPITQGQLSPWDDSGTRAYTTRFHFDCLSDSPNAQPTWDELQQQWGKKYPPQFRSFNDPAQQQVLAQYFDTAPIPDPYRDEERDAELKRLGYDLRSFAMRSIAQRQGQPQFRNKLIRAYEGQCAVTRTDITSVLEAAHIARYLGPQTNRTNNGLLLRGDIHTLFDLHRLTVSPKSVVRVDPALGAPYNELDGVTIHLPTKASEHPLQSLLSDHNAECDWL